MKMKVEVKKTKSEGFYIVEVETENCKFTLFYTYNADFDAWALVEPKNEKGYKVFTLSNDFKSTIKTEVLNIINN